MVRSLRSSLIVVALLAATGCGGTSADRVAIDAGAAAALRRPGPNGERPYDEATSRCLVAAARAYAPTDGDLATVRAGRRLGAERLADLHALAAGCLATADLAHDGYDVATAADLVLSALRAGVA